MQAVRPDLRRHRHSRRLLEGRSCVLCQRHWSQCGNGDIGPWLTERIRQTMCLKNAMPNGPSRGFGLGSLLPHGIGDVVSV